MDIFRYHYSDQDALSSNSWSPDIIETSSTSDSAIIPLKEEVMLASKNPKKRAGRKKFRETRHPVYRGVRRRNSDKWVCEMREPNKKSRIWLGTFPTADMAARAHDVAAIALRGKKACLNFADSAWRLYVPESTNAKDIQKAAAQAAEMFSHAEEEKVVEVRKEDGLYIDEEAVFGMPGLLRSMAEGLLMPPPYCVEDDDRLVDYADLSLWSYSV